MVLNSRVSFASLTLNNLGTVQRLNSVLFPIKYTEKFYEGKFLQTWFSMGVLAPYRSRGLDFQTLQLILDAAISHEKPGINKIYLHFYEKHGFKQVGLHENYYKKIVPHDAWILEKTIER
ncbi:hypothetical protein K435DRAFT_824382 [Dendrothele bispora CBS 962.96]|uniref:N-acetyltransferase domain-containing protein n=1 Tax=Dendrothele bispora (strain CBS 962.96) TaxID=1314807 RepID=A0A4S8KNX3_DENBC|nr:hypothetical protein K435DRAFT_824382 [Dendrothele bispora CBS 962.96]